MGVEHRPLRWWGWGDPEHGSVLPDHAASFLREHVGVDGSVVARPVAHDDVRVGESTLDGGVRSRFAKILGTQHVRDDREDRILHAAGKSYPDLLRVRSGDCEHAPDAVVYPAGHEQVRALLDACAREEVAVVPFGGGTSVVGGVEPLRAGFQAVIAIDTGRMAALVHLDRQSRTAVLTPGLRGPEAERLLNVQGFTLGHFPQSYEYATVGGYVATRSAGQASTGYGRIDELVRGVHMVAPAGDISLAPLPASAAGPQLRDLVVGSEGALGVITAAALSVVPEPACKRYEGWFFRSFAEAIQALRAVEQAGVAPQISRVSDESETRMSLALAGQSTAHRVADRYLRLRGYDDGAFGVFGWEGDEEDVARRRARSVAALRKAGGLAVGAGPGRAWARGRFDGPYLRDDLLDRGVFVETLETATQWSNVGRLYAAVGDALRSSLAARGTPPLVLCHISHLYASGCSLYFTWLARQDDEPLEQWRAAKTDACNAIVAAGGTITHHHGVGRDHAPWLSSEVGESGTAVLRAVKAQLDPVGIMNPGKLLPEA